MTVNRRQFIFDTCAAILALKFPRIAIASGASNDDIVSQRLHRIAFGSCNKPWLPQNIWSSILNSQADLFLHLGDTVYVDAEELKKLGRIRALESAYARLSELKQFRHFRSAIPIHATWDDNDYTRDGGADFDDKQVARKLFLDFWRADDDDLRRTQAGGIYAAYEYGPLDSRVQLILLDTRFGRSALLKASELELQSRPIGAYYSPNQDSEARMLHEEQWQWLEKQLQRPAQLRLICSSIQFMADFRGYESWANFPLERARLIKLIEKTRANGVMFLSGDTHYSELTCETDDVPYPIWDITSSALTHAGTVAGKNSNRFLEQTIHEKNFGLVDIAWEMDDPLIGLSIYGADQALKLQHKISLNSLRH